MNSKKRYDDLTEDGYKQMGKSEEAKLLNEQIISGKDCNGYDNKRTKMEKHESTMEEAIHSYTNEHHRTDEDRSINKGNSNIKQRTCWENHINDSIPNNTKGNKNEESPIRENSNTEKWNVRNQINEGEQKMKEMIKLRNMNLCYENKCEKLGTISKMNGRKKMFKLILENVDLSPEEVMKNVLTLLKKTTKINTKIKINDKLYKIKYKELTPEDHILFLDEVKNIINCKYLYIGVLTVSKYIDENKFDEKSFQNWQMEDAF